ncbi:hypothetical protein FPOAC1_003844 [Fusarium poae]|uniref:hypothetical protein n=1 Tax=Fusarium poae TaxID=36050 RepID=UPI001CEB5276|nr:hypothetical protein FPOAC1_003844 [Fusarium poae]KAG8677816.1 hypothetical protein FPOAC1_003844 [Fusarium poae]
MANLLQRPFQLADESLFHCSSLINGDFVSAKDGTTFNVIDPGSEKTWASCPDCTASDVDSAVASSYETFKTYSKTTPRFRAQALMKWHNLIFAAREDLSRILVHETGKTLVEARGEIDYALTFVWWFSGEADRAHGTSLTCAIPGRRAITIKQPIGVVAALVPWNFPIALALRKAAAALAAGCTMVIKPSPETPLTGVSIGYLALEAGFPPGALNVVTTSLENTPTVAEALCLDARVKKACITSNRVFVHNDIYDTFVEKIVQETRKLKVGHGMEESSTMGALTTPRGLDKAEELYQDAISKGAKTVLGTGRREDGDGYFMAPTILTGMEDNMLMTHEEIFAPVLGCYRFESEDEVVQRANDTPLGLASYVFTKNVDRLWRLFENLDAGMIGLNTGNGSSAEAPFGGMKDSGHGKESGKDVAIDEFLISKTATLTIDGHH